MEGNRMVSLLHTADTHLGYRQYHRPEREADFRDAFYHVIDAAIAEEVDAVVHAGDLFDSSRPGIDALSDALTGLKRLREADIPFLSIVGNHDGTRDRQWIDVFASLGLATRLGDAGFSVRSEGCHLALYGLDYVDPGRRNRLDYAFDPEAATGADAAVLVAHGLFEPFPNGDWDARAIRRQSSVEFDAILAGDDHTNRETVLSEFGTLLIYPGSTERTAADQREPRGYGLVDVDGSGEIEREFRELDTREFVYVDIELNEGEGLDRVLAALEDRVRDRRAVTDSEREGTDEAAGEGESGFEEAVVVVTLTGAGERVSSGPIEEFGLGREALTVRVNDRREFDDDLGEYGEVAFADPERAVEERRRTLGLSGGGREIEDVIRDTDAVPESNVTEVIEGRVREWLDERPIGTFERTDPEPAEEATAEGNEGDDGNEDEGGNEGEGKDETANVRAAGTGTAEAEAASEGTETNGRTPDVGDPESSETTGDSKTAASAADADGTGDGDRPDGLDGPNGPNGPNGPDESEAEAMGETEATGGTEAKSENRDDGNSGRDRNGGDGGNGRDEADDGSEADGGSDGDGRTIQATLWD